MSTEKCDPLVYKYGVQTHVTVCSKEEAERFCADATRLTGQRHDWHYVGGRVAVLAIPPHIQKLLNEVKRLRRQLKKSKSTNTPKGTS